MIGCEDSAEASQFIRICPRVVLGYFSVLTYSMHINFSLFKEIPKVAISSQKVFFCIHKNICQFISSFYKNKDQNRR